MRKNPAARRASPAPEPGSARRQATNLSLDLGLLAEAKVLGVNLSRAAERGLALAIAERRSEAWLAENQAAIRSSNAYVERRGLPLARFRKF